MDTVVLSKSMLNPRLDIYQTNSAFAARFNLLIHIIQSLLQMQQHLWIHPCPIVMNGQN